MISADVNYYAIDPFNNPFAVVNSTVAVDTKCPPLFLDYTAVRVCDDHVVIKDSVNILRVPYFDAKMKDLPSFWGSVPRWYIPHVKLEFSGEELPLTVTLMVVDVRKENFVSVGFDWPPIDLSQNEIMI